MGDARAVQAVAGTPSLRRGMPLRPAALRSRPFRRQPPIATLAIDAQSRADPAEYERKVLREKGE